MSTDQEARTATVTTPTETEIRLERVFDAPREHVFAAFTDPELIPEWWGPGTTVDEMDVRTGGTWRFVTTYPGGESAVRGTFREVVPPELIVQTFESEAMPGRVHVQTFTFEEVPEGTRLTTVLLFDTTEERDGVLRYGAESGANESYARLDALLARLAG